MLAEKSRPLQDTPARWLTDLILGQQRTFTTQLVGRGPYSEYYGNLSITLDTATYGEGFLINAVIIFISGCCARSPWAWCCIWSITGC